MNRLAQRIISLLSNENGYVKSNIIAKKLGVSSKTIYRAIKLINQKQDIIKSQRGLGYIIKGEIFDEKDIDKVSELTSRAYSIAIYILFSQPVNLRFIEIANKFYISESAMSKELRKIDQLLSRFKLKIFRKNGYVSVLGEEVRIRQALNFLLIRKGSISTSFDLVSEVFPSISQRDKEFLISQITLIQEQLNVTLVDPYTLNIFSHLYIMMERILVAQKRDREEVIDIESIENENFYEISRMIIENISIYLGQTINSDEVVYLTQYLKSLRYINKNTTDLEEIDVNEATLSPVVYTFAKYIVDNYKFSKKINKTKLLADLYGHLKPMLNRMDKNLDVVNPLVKEVKRTYPEEFGKLKKIVDQYTILNYQTKVSDDEIAFLVLYIVKAIEEGYQASRVLVMCSSGIGTAQLIKTRLLNAIPNIDIIGVISSYNYLSRMDQYNTEADLIISTVAIPKESKIPIVLVTPLLNELDLKRVRKFLNV